MSDPTIEQQAANLGWVPQDQWKGDPSVWTDAETFVRRGEEVIPIIKANNKELQRKLAEKDEKLAALANQVSEHAKTLKEFQEYSLEQMRGALEAQERRLRGELKEAREAGDVDAEEDARAGLDEVRANRRKLEATPPPPTPTATPPGDHPDFAAWKVDNPWYGTDAERTELAQAFAIVVKQKNPNLVGRAFFDKVVEELDRKVPRETSAPTTTSKVSSSRPGGGASGGAARGYEALPAEAKAQCDKDAKRFVGPNKMFKDEASWRAHYTQQYNLAAGVTQ